jgi:hypothetical protein
MKDNKTLLRPWCTVQDLQILLGALMHICVVVCCVSYVGSSFVDVNQQIKSRAITVYHIYNI